MQTNKTTTSSTVSYTIMVVDDQPANLRLFERLLKGHQYRVLAFNSGALALRALQRTTPDLIVLDIKMPELDGWEVNEQLKTNPKLADIPVLFLSGLSDLEAKAKAFASGGVDYITKPFQSEEVVARIETHIRLHRLKRELAEHNRQLKARVLAQVAQISNSQRATITALARLAESRDDDTGSHIMRVQQLCKLLARQLYENKTCRGELDEAFIDDIYHASALHDIGKVATPDAILLKPGKLSAEELEIMKQHTVAGCKTLKKVIDEYPDNTMVVMGALIARHHHERWDGRGYPDGLAGEEIPLAARIMAVADVYDALRSKRPYKLPFNHEASVEIIMEGAGANFDPVVIEAFKAVESTVRQCRDEFDRSPEAEEV